MAPANLTTPPPPPFNFTGGNITGNNTLPPPPPYPPPPPPSYEGQFIIGPDTKVTDAALRSAVVVDVVIGSFFMIMFIICQSQSVLYKLRLTTRSVSVKPPPLPVKSASATFAWLVAALMTSDQDLVESCGLDALMFTKLFTYGIQLLLPVALLSVSVLLPIHTAGDFLASDTEFGNQATFMKTTMTNIRPGDPVLWVHTVFVFMYITWGCWLLKFHYTQFVTIRHHWLRTGDDVNEWRLEYEIKRAGEQTKPPPKLLALFTAVKTSMQRGAIDSADLPAMNGSGPNSPTFGPGSHLPDEAPGSEAGRPSRQTVQQMRAGSGALSGGGSAAAARARRLEKRATIRRRRTSAAVLREQEMSALTAAASAASPFEHAGPLSVHERSGEQMARRMSTVSSRTSVGPPRTSAMEIDWSTTDQELLDILDGEFQHKAATRKTHASADGTGGDGAEGEWVMGGARRLTKHLTRFLSKKPMRLGGVAEVQLGDGGPGSGGGGTAQEGVHSDGGHAPGSHTSQLPSHPLSQPFSYLNPLADEGRQAGEGEQDAAEGRQPVDSHQIEVVVVQQDRAPETEKRVQLPPALMPVLEQLELPSAPETPSSVTPALLASTDLPAQDAVTQPEGQRSLKPQVSVSARYTADATSALSPVAVPPPPQSASMRVSGASRDSKTPAHLAATSSEPVPRATSAPHSKLRAKGMSLWRRMHKRSASSRDAEHSDSAKSDKSDASSSKEGGSKQDTADLSTVAELPRWWEGISTVYDPLAVAAERRQKKARSGRHNKAHTHSPSTSGGVGSSKRLEGVTSSQWGLSPSGKSLPATHSEAGVTTQQSARYSEVQDGVQGEETGVQGIGQDHPSGTPDKDQGASAAPVVEQKQALWRPSVRLLRTINTHDEWGCPVSVNAQQYAVLVTDVNQNLWHPKKPLWPRERHTHELLTRILPPTLKSWIMNDYAVQALSLYDDTDSEQDELDGPEEAGFSHLTKASHSLELLRQASRRVSRDLHGSHGHHGSSRTSRHGSDAGRRNSHSLTSQGPFGFHGTQGAQDFGHSGSLVQGVQGVQGLDGVRSSSGAPHSAGGHSASVHIDCMPGPEGGASLGAGTGAGVNGEVSDAAKRQAARARWHKVSCNIHKVLKLPSSASRYSVVTATFKQMFPEDFDRAIPILPHKQVDLLLLQLDWHQQQYTNAVRERDEKRSRPQGRIRMFGPKVDLIDHHSQKMSELQDKVKAMRKQVLDSGYAPSWLVFFKRQQAAAMCCGRVFHSEDIRDFNVHPAPGPEEVNWPALWMSYHQRDRRSWLTNTLLLLLILLPVGIVTGAAMQVEFLFCPLIECRNTVTNDVYTTRGACDSNSVANVNGAKQTFRWNWYCDKDSFISLYLTKFITGWLPSLLLMLWQNMVLPISMLMLSQAGGRCLSFSMLDMQVAKYMFWYNLFQSFLGGVLGSAFVQQVSALFEAGPGQTLVVLGSFLPASSNFFMAYMLLRALVMVPMRMFIPHLGIRMYWFRRYMFRWGSAPPSSREYAIMYQKTSLRIGFEVGMTLLMLLIPMTYAVLAPMMTVLGLGFFLMSWVCWRYAILYIYIRKYESGGMLWPHVCSRMLIVFGCFGIFTACVMVVKQAYTQAILLLVLVPIGLAQFNRHISGGRFQTALEHVPLTMASHAPAASVDPTCYIPPPLIPGSRIWHPEWAKPWQGWNLPIGYSVT